MKRLAEIFIGAFVNLALCLAVTADTVFTRDGRVHQGQISLGTNATLRVVSPGSTNVVTATNLLRAVFGGAAYNPGFPDITAKLYPNFQKTPKPTLAWQTTDKAVPAPGVMTRNGSFLPGRVIKVNDARIHFGKTTLSRLDASALFLKSLTLAEAKRLHGKPAGVLLLNGDFVHGELRGLNERTLTLNSILFGLHEYETGREAVAVMLKPAAKAGPRHRFKLRDGSQIFAANYKIRDKKIILPGRAIPWPRLAEMTSGPQSNLLQASAAYWEALPATNRQTLLTDDRNKTSLARQYGEWQTRLTNAEAAMAVAKRDLPALAKAEAEALADQAKALAARNAARQKVTANTQAHNQANTALTAARAKLEADCLNLEQAGQALARLIATSHDPARQKLAAAQQNAIAIAVAQAVNNRDLAAAQAAIAQASLARQAAAAAAQTTATTLTAAKAKLTLAQAALTAADNDFQARQKAATDAHTTLANAHSTQLAPALGGWVAAHKALAQALQDQASADAKVFQLGNEVQTATANSQAAAQAAQATATVAAAKAATTMKALTTAQAKLTTATNATATARQTLETLQATGLNPALAKAKTTNRAVTDATKEKAKADQSLVTVKNVAAQAMKTAAETAKLAQTKFEPEQINKDLAATQTLAQQLKALAQAAQTPIDEVIADRQKPAQAALTAATQSLAQAMVEKKAADLALATLKVSIGKAATALANAEQAAVTAQTRAQTALTTHTTATNSAATAMKDFEAKQTATGTAQKTVAEKFGGRQQAAQALGAAAANIIHANFNKTEAVRAAALAEVSLSTATAKATATAEAAETATTAVANVKTQATAAQRVLSTAKSTANKKRTAASKSMNALGTLAPKQSAANTKAALASREFVRAKTAHAAAAQSLATATGQVEKARANLQKIEQVAKVSKNPDEAAVLKKQITEAKQALNQLVKVVQKQATAKMTAAATARTKANTAKDTADRVLTPMNARGVAATTAARLAEAELGAAAGALIAAQSKLNEAMVVQQLADARSATAQAAAAEASRQLTEATAADRAATALAGTVAIALTKAGTGQAAAAKASATAIQQITVAIMAHRAALKVQGEAEATVKLAGKKIDQTATALADAQKFAKQQRGFADAAKQALDALSVGQQKKVMDSVTAATAAITQSQADMTAASEILKPIEAELAMLVQTVLLVEQAEAVVVAIMKTLKAKAVLGAKLAAEKKLLVELSQKAAESFVAVNQKRAMDQVTKAGTDLTEAKADQAAAGKESMTIKLKTADATTVFVMAGQTQRDAEAGVKLARTALAKALEEKARAGMLAGEKAKPAADAKARLADLIAEQKLAVAAAGKAKADLAKVTADQVRATQAFNSANTAVVAVVLSHRAAGMAARESDEKAKAARVISRKLNEELAALELQAAAWKAQTARIVSDRSRLTARWQTPATQQATRLNTAFTQAVTVRTAAEQALAAAHAAVASQELARRTAIETGLASDTAELKAQQAEADAWRELVQAQQAATETEADNKKSLEEYRDKKKQADTVRGKQSTAQREATTSKAQLTRLKPAFEAIVQP